ncbi:MAG: hypothetical protein H7122_11940 [Chitinophagaceae bacterium]|nr:hypothetical protein [Chitinophagaceae bacterium]
MKPIPEQHFSAEDSLRLIQRMISTAKQEISDQSFNFLLWGWAAFAACIGQFVLKVYFDYRHHYIVWLITIPCIFITIYSARNYRKERKVKTYVNTSMSYLWAGMGISFFVMSMLFVKLGWFNCYPFFILLYGLGAFVSGKFLQFTPFIVGGIISWCLATVAVWFSFDYQALFAAGALLFTHIIPGHLLQKTHSVSSIH